MRARSSVLYVRATLLSALGLGVVHCGSGTATTSADGGPLGPDGGHVNPDGSVGVTPKCTNPVPYLVNGQPTGFDTCDGNVPRRRTPGTCPSMLPRAGGGACTSGGATDAGLPAGGCLSDKDCTTQAFGHCEPNGGIAGCRCLYGCTKDSDCTAGNICYCGSPTGACVPAACTDATGCVGSDCLQYKTNNCGGQGFACLTAMDTCLSDTDCQTPMGGGMFCGYVNGARTCQPAGPCGTGRPFLVAGLERVAPTAGRKDWLVALEPQVIGLDPAVRGELADRWTELAQMEHASVAAFARFALELMSLGAPALLLAETSAAMSDETEHARLCFALASAYAERPIGPGPLAVDGCLDVSSERARDAMIANLVREGCIGETIAAIEAREAASFASDPLVARVLTRVAEDEGRHAALAWRTLAWAIESGGQGARERIVRELDRAIEERAARAPDQTRDDLLTHGIVGGTLRADIARDALDQAIRPARAALALPPSPARAVAAVSA